MHLHLGNDLKEILNQNFVFITLVNFMVMLGDYQFFTTGAFFAVKELHSTISEAGIAAGLFVVGS